MRQTSIIVTFLTLYTFWKSRI